MQLILYYYKYNVILFKKVINKYFFVIMHFLQLSYGMSIISCY